MIAQTVPVQVGGDSTLNSITLGLAVVTAIMALATVYLGWQTRESVGIARRALLHEHTDQVKQWARSRHQYIEHGRLTNRVEGHIDMTEPLAEIFAEHFGTVATLIAEWNGAMVRFARAWRELNAKAAADTIALGFQPANNWPIFFSARQYAVGQPAQVDALELEWTAPQVLADRLSENSVFLDRPVTDAEALALPQRLKDRCVETQYWLETIEFDEASRACTDIEMRLDRAFKKIDARPELAGTCLSEGGGSRLWPWARRRGDSD
jgi:hypothetical protein